MVGLEVVAGFLAAWAVRKARRVAGAVDGQADVAIDAGLDRLHRLVIGKLGADTALSQLETEAVAGGASQRTQDRVRLAVEEGCDGDPEFAAALRQLLDQLAGLGAAPQSAVAGDRGLAVAGDLNIRADNHSVAALRMGDVSLGGGGAADPPVPGRSRG